jgi:hypothetical protein
MRFAVIISELKRLFAIIVLGMAAGFLLSCVTQVPLNRSEAYRDVGDAVEAGDSVTLAFVNFGSLELELLQDPVHELLIKQYPLKIVRVEQLWDSRRMAYNMGRHIPGLNTEGVVIFLSAGGSGEGGRINMEIWNGRTGESYFRNLPRWEYILTWSDRYLAKSWRPQSEYLDEFYGRFPVMFEQWWLESIVVANDV